MSGHSKWANIKHKKAASDAKKGKVFSKLAKEIQIVAAKSGGDLSANPTLRTLVQKARGVNMPADNIDRAIKKGTGELAAAAMEEITYEAFASGGVSLLIQVLTDNKNRSAAEIRHLFSRHGGNLAAVGSVSRNYARRGQIWIAADKVAEDRLMELALDAGAADMQTADGQYEITTEPAQFTAVTEALAKAGITPDEAEISMVPLVPAQLTDKAQAQSVLKFIEALEELDDVQNVYHNMELDDAMMAEIAGA